MESRGISRCTSPVKHGGRAAEIVTIENRVIRARSTHGSRIVPEMQQTLKLANESVLSRRVVNRTWTDVGEALSDELNALKKVGELNDAEKVPEPPVDLL